MFSIGSIGRWSSCTAATAPTGCSSPLPPPHATVPTTSAMAAATATSPTTTPRVLLISPLGPGRARAQP